MRVCSGRDQSIDSSGESSLRPNQRQIMVVVLKWVGMATLFGIITFFTVFGIDFNSHVSLKEWISPVKVQHQPLACVNNGSFSTVKKNGIIPSVPVVEGFTCYEFASTLKPSRKQQQQQQQQSKTYFHTYWDSSVLTDKHVDTIRSFLATQNLEYSQLVIWTLDKALLERQIPKDDHIQILDTASLFNNQSNQRSTTNKDWIQLSSLYKYGGVWFDMQALFVRDMSLLVTQEWTAEGGCKTKDFFNGAFVHFFRNSRFLCEIMNQYDEQKSLDQVYQHVYHQLLENKKEPWSILPWCYTDPSNCHRSNSLPSAFQSNTDFSKSNLQQVFAYHYHASFWSSKPGALYKYLVNQHKNKVSSF